MASIGRSGAATFRAAAAHLRSRGAALPKRRPSSPSPFPFSSAAFVRRSVVSLESLMPLHSAVASARLRSFIASDSSYWSCLSQGLNKRI